MNPVISIITVCYNSEKYIESTIKSVLDQSYPNIEYLIIDGASTDKTPEIIQKYASKISHWISEPDKGLYDAMNKGLQLATGDFVWFINAGDVLARPTIVVEMLQVYTAETDILYGEVMMVDEAGTQVGTRSEITPHQLPNDLNWKSLQRGMVVSHQAFLPRRSIAPMYMDSNLAADIDWVIVCLKRAKKVSHTKLILAHFLLGGTSRQRHQESLKNRYTILQKHYGFVGNLFNHSWIVLRAIWFKIKRRGKVTY